MIRLARTMAVAVAVLGALVLAGWALDQDLLKSGVPGLVAMNPATAICFILSSSVLLLRDWKSSAKTRDWLELLCAAAVVLVGVSVLSRYVFGWELAPDQWLFHDRLSSPGAAHPNRMAPNTAFMFVLLGLSFLAMRRPGMLAWRVAELLALSIGFLAFMAIIGYLYGAHFLYGISSYIPIALNTAFAFGALTIATLAHQPGRGVVALVLSPSPGGVLLRRLLPIFIAIPVLLGLLRLQGERAGLYDTAAGAAMMVALTVLLLGAAIWWGAVSLNRTDAARTLAEQEVRKINQELEGRVAERTEELRGQKEQLRKTANELEALVQAAPVAIVGINLDGTVSSWYGGAEAMFGWTAEEVVGRTLANVPPEKQEEFSALRRRVLHGESILALETYRARKDGSRVHVSISYAPLHDRARKIVGAIIVYQDITERRLMAEQRQAREAAEAANRAKSSFLANMSHELRTPLNAIIGFSELLQDQTFGPLNEKQQRYVNNVQSSGRHLLQLVNDILDLAKVEAGRLVLESEPVDVARLLEEMQRGLEPLAVAKRQSLALEVPERLPNLLADRGKLKQILYNLLSNAIKFTKEGGRCGIRVAPVPENGSQPEVQIAVWDTGIGIAPEDLGRIFLEFEQLDSSYVREQEGTGLGLALTRRLVEAHGGRISVESVAGQGTTFTVVLPAAGSGSAPVTPGSTPLRLVGQNPGRPLVLVVEDDSTGRELLAHYLIENGYAVAYAGTGGEAHQAARRLKPAAISLDILLPDVNGLEVLTQLRGDPETRHIPVIVVSIADDRELGLSAGAAAWLVKPVRRRQFIEALDRLMPGGTSTENSLALVVDDDAEAVELASDILRQRGFEVIQAFGGNEGLTLALERLPSLIILDLSMPGVSGFTVAQQLRDDPRTRRIPILVSTALDLSAAEREDLLRHVQTIVPKSGAEGILEALERLGLTPERERQSSGSLEKGVASK